MSNNDQQNTNPLTVGKTVKVQSSAGPKRLSQEERDAIINSTAAARSILANNFSLGRN